MNQELPFTEAIADFVRARAASNGRPVQTVLLVLGFASLIPLVLSVLFLLAGRLLNYGTLIIWIFFLGVGVLAAYGVLQDVGRFGRDLAGGVYLRWTGPFKIRVIRSRYGSTGQVQVGGRKLSNESALAAVRSEVSGGGTVDYLPITGTVLELRDAAGQLLWTRLSGRT